MDEYVYVDETIVKINANGFTLQDDITNYAAKFFRTNEAASDIFFPGLRWRSRDGRAYILERPPEIVEIFFTPTRARYASREAEQVISLPIPWTVWYFEVAGTVLHATAVWARPAQITSLDDPLHCLPLPNMDSTGSHCQGNAYCDYVGAAAGLSLIERFSVFITTFWNSGFNLDLDASALIPQDLLIEKFSGIAMGERTIQWLNYWSSLSLEQALQLKLQPSPRGNTIRTVGDVIADYERKSLAPAPTTPAQLLVRFR